MVPLGDPMVPLGDPMLPLGDPMLPLGDPMLPLGDPMLPLGEPMVPLGEPMVPLLESTNGSLVGEDQNHFPPAGGLPQALFFLPKIAFLGEKHHFPRLAACRRRFFMVKNDHFGVAGAARREHNSSFPKNSSISHIETSF